MSHRRLVIAGTGSSVGKTTVTIGIMSAFQQMGYIVQGYKCGPDYIDPSYHTAVTGRRSRNLDSWMLSPSVLKEVLHRGNEGADICIIEGVMGFYDGKDPTKNEGSTAEISMLTDSPVVLVVDCSGMARSAAAIVRGFQALSNDVNIVGVIANKVGGEGHFQLIKKAVEQECNIPVVGYLNKEMNLEMPERHLGLIPSIERGELDSFLSKLGELVIDSVDMTKLYELGETTPLKLEESSLFKEEEPARVRIAVARDKVFNFYYEENLELLKAYGAELIYFSPLNGELLPANVDGLYIGGGFPEEYAAELSEQTEVHLSIKRAIQKGLPTFAECGGFMYLCEALSTLDQKTHPMVGVIPGVVKMETRLAAIGYREITGEKGNFLLKEGEAAKGHEFHYSTFHPKLTMEMNYAYETKGMRGTQKEGYLHENVVAGYTHIHFASCTAIVENWITKCLEWKSHV
ncbi:cobyrinic acid a,c-diamide synthase [Evansella vedderi]|uniref:Cobyrinate a,c-diamide synthase n=1 Tax=Evansella vedderi TaxID=38282 RepID=A0ABU0A010_9BACI|nr:cobyrinate a,c-diamide synthase [Evansella vedderi]MDQ0256347.1 cobyrinic acid a,c-diamide synthase [Evansella vedderi]